jgi:hypothetical protein
MWKTQYRPDSIPFAFVGTKWSDKMPANPSNSELLILFGVHAPSFSVV